MAHQTKYLLAEKDIPTAWYNIQADLPEPLPPVLHRTASRSAPTTLPRCSQWD